MKKPKVLVDSTHHVVLKRAEDTSQRYKDYRKRWEENPKKHIVGEFPIHLDIETTPLCNLRCVMCFQSFDPPKGKHMEWQLYQRIIDEGSKYGLCSVKLMYRGEPLIHPEVVKQVRYAKDKGVIEVMFNSNCALLSEEMSRKLIEAGLDLLICSIDHYEAEAYEKIRVGAKFDKVVQNLKNLQKIKKELGVTKPILRVQACDFPDLDKQKYIEFWEKIADNIAFNDLMDYEEEKKTDHPPLVAKDFACPQLWQRLFVMWNGDVHMCCGDHYLELKLGNVKETSIHDIWTGKQLNGIRELHLKGESHKIPLCNKCYTRKKIIEHIREMPKSADED